MFYSVGESFDARNRLDDHCVTFIYSAGTSEEEEEEEENDGEGGEGGGGEDGGREEGDGGGGRECGDQDTDLPATRHRSL